METRFSFHPVKKILLVSSCGELHADTIRKEGKRLPFDSWIRGIIAGNKVYFRTFYPDADIDEMDGESIRKTSFSLTFDALKNIKEALHKAKIKTPSKVAYNVTNDDLRGVLVNL
jgi:hypothetical protein